MKRRRSYGFSHRGAHCCLRGGWGKRRDLTWQPAVKHQRPAAKTTNGDCCARAAAQVSSTYPNNQSERTASTLLLLLFAGTIFCEILRFGKIANLSTRKNFYKHIRHPGVYTITNCVMIFHFGSCVISLLIIFAFFFSSFPPHRELEKVTIDDIDDRGSFTIEI